jgi:hypothetical protein
MLQPRPKHLQELRINSDSFIFLLVDPERYSKASLRSSLIPITLPSNFPAMTRGISRIHLQEKVGKNGGNPPQCRQSHRMLEYSYSMFVWSAGNVFSEDCVLRRSGVKLKVGRNLACEPTDKRSLYVVFSCCVDTRCNETTKSSSDRCFWSFLGDLPCIRLSKPWLP